MNTNTTFNVTSEYKIGHTLYTGDHRVQPCFKGEPFRYSEAAHNP